MKPSGEGVVRLPNIPLLERASAMEARTWPAAMARCGARQRDPDRGDAPKRGDLEHMPTGFVEPIQCVKLLTFSKARKRSL